MEFQSRLVGGIAFMFGGNFFIWFLLKITGQVPSEGMGIWNTVDHFIVGAFYFLLVAIPVGIVLYLFFRFLEKKIEAVSNLENKMKDRLNQIFSELSKEQEINFARGLKQFEESLLLIKKEQEKIKNELEELKKTPEVINQSALEQFIGGHA